MSCLKMPCPSCGVTVWVVPTSVEVELTFDGTTILAVRLTESLPIQSEGDIRCAGCGEVLLDWGSREDDEAWNAHHDERRPAWNELHYEAAGAGLPPFDRWTRAEAGLTDGEPERNER